MKQKVLSTAIAASILASGQAYSGDADVFVFLENNPLQGVDVAINGNVIGQTNTKGAASTYISESGNQEITISRQGEQLAAQTFSLDNPEQDVEISVVLSTEDKPKLSVYKIGEDNQAAAIGFLRGQIRDENDNPIADALVSIDGTDFSEVSDNDGKYAFDLPRGNYDMSVTHADYRRQDIPNLRVVANVGTAAIVKLFEKTEQDQAARPQFSIAAPVEEVLILGTFGGAENSSFEIEQMSTAVVDAIDLEQIIRFGDSNAASVLKRVVGVSIVDGKYAVIRGLSGRYIASTLNKNLMPTTNPYRRDAELDLFPADILGGIDIQKSFSADLPADSTAGTIFVKTQDMPTDYTNKLSISVGVNTGLTGDDILSYEGGDSDFWGIDDGFREIPSGVNSATQGGLDFSICQVAGQTNCVTADQAVAVAGQLPNVWNTKTESTSPNYDISYSLGNVFDLSLGTLGVYSSVSFDKEYSSKIDAFVDNPLEEEGVFSEDTISTSLNGYLVAGIELNDGDKIDSKTMILRNTDSTTRVFAGIDNGEDSEFQTTNLEWKERQFFGQQFSGHHFFFEDQELDWRAGISQTTNDIPDRRSYTYLGDFLAISTVERLYGELTEDATDFGVDYKIPMEINDSWRTEIKLGALYNKKDRENEVIRIGVRQGSNPIRLNNDLETLLNIQNFADDAFRLKPDTTRTDKYEADQETQAFYVSTETHYNDLVTIVAGFRQEDFTQSLLLPNILIGEQGVDKDTDGVYPQLGLIYRPSESWQIRASISETISRPTLTEVAPARFYDDRAQQFIGNPLLESSDIQNFDLRVDYYFEDEGSISLALFSKTIDNPVEVGISDASGSASGSLTWRNEKEATLDGIELDISKEFLNNGKYTAFVGSNLTFIDSEVTLTDDSVRLQNDAVRDLQGQSPVLANVQIGFDHIETDQKFTLLANYFDDRIDQVRRSPEEVIYEVGRITFDFNYDITFENESSFKVKVKNITNAKVEYEQAGRIVEGWEDGTKISVGYSYNF